MKRFFISLLVLLFLCVASNSVLYGMEVKKASDYGFAVSNDGDSNRKALQAALDGGGRVEVSVPGTYNLAGTVFIDSDTELVFSEGVVINKCYSSNGTSAAYVFVNRGAYDRTYNENIKISGLNIKMNGIDQGYDMEPILGLMGNVSFFYVKNLEITDFTTLDIGPMSFAIQICTFENIRLERIHIEGRKDGIHLGRGSGFYLKDCKMRTYDDPIALNAHDYIISNPELGWLENGVVDNCTDLSAESTSGFFCRILAGSWIEWKEGMEVQNSDAVISDGRIYRVHAEADGKNYISRYKPVHLAGEKDYGDGIKWAMTQDKDVVNMCGVRNVTFKNISLEKKRTTAFSIYFDNEAYSRSYYPYAESPVQRNFTFDGIDQKADITALIFSVTPVDTIRIRDSIIRNGRLMFRRIEVPGCDYPPIYVELDNVLFCGDKDRLVLFENDYGLDINVVMNNCRTDRPELTILTDNVNVIRKSVSYVDDMEYYAENNVIYIKCNEIRTVRVYDASGKKVFEKKLGEGWHATSVLPDGVYIVNGKKILL